MKPLPFGRTGVCVVRAEPQDDLLLVSVTANTDVEHRGPTRLYGHAMDEAATLDLVARFLREMADQNAITRDASRPDG